MKPRILLRWPNPIRGSRDGATVIWTEEGRPQAVCCVYIWNDRDIIALAFGSMSTGPLSSIPSPHWAKSFE